MTTTSPNPCPFPHCGSTKTTWMPVPNLPQKMAAVHCPKCKASGPVAETPAEAGALWNGAGEWVSIDDDMPKSGRPVLVSQNGYPLATRAYYDAVNRVWVGHYVAHENVSHWRTLPAPPK